MAKIKVTMIRSVIKRPKNQRLTLEALGLRGIGQSVVHESNPDILGMINKVNHLVSVETV
jgi:large subunit ribosomal protein L30